MAARRRRGERGPLSLKLHVIAGALVAVLPLLGWITVQGSRALTIAAYAGEIADPSMTATLLSRGLFGQAPAITLVAITTLLVLLPWFAAVVLTLRARRSDGGGRSLLSVVLMIGAGLLAMALGVIRWGIGVIAGLNGVAGVDPTMKRAFLEPQLNAAREQLALSAQISTVAIALLAVIAAISIVRGRRGGAGAAPSPGSARRAVTLSVVTVALAALLVVQARPLAAENALPWPPRGNSAMFTGGRSPTPDLVGPDAPGHAPVVAVYRDRLTVDGASVDIGELKQQLVILHQNFTLLHPSEAFDGTALIQAGESTPIADLASVLRALVGVQYDRPTFLFVAKKTLVRPAFGTLAPVFASGARAKVAHPGGDDRDAGDWKDAVRLLLADSADYGAFARRVVELRTAGKPVVIEVGRSE
jgi:hypothetical protein